ncbi:unnamed protein product [Calypogeia fissa]
MTLVAGIARDQLLHDSLNYSIMADDGPSLMFCNLPPRQSVSEFEPSRMSYYNGNEHLSVPFKWEAAPGTPIVDQSTLQADHPESRLQLRPPPSASNSPLNPLVQPSYKDPQSKSGLLSKVRNYSRPEFGTFSMSSRSSGSATTADSSSNGNHGNHGHHDRNRSKGGSMSRRSDFDWPEVSDDEYSSPRATVDAEPHAASSSTVTTPTRKQWSFSSSSFSSASSELTPSPVNSGAGARVGASTRDLFVLRNFVNFTAAASAAAPSGTCYVHGGVGGRSPSTQSSEDGESEEGDDHVRPGGFLSCMPIFAKFRMIQTTFGASQKQMPAINFSKLTPGSRNRGYRPNYRQSL